MHRQIARLSAVGPWLAGTAAAFGVLGPAFGSGALLNLDLVVLPNMPVPTGVWGLGPQLPRDIPYAVPVAWISHVMGAMSGKLFLAAALTIAFVGAYRLAEGAPVVCRTGAGVVYALSPFMLTRVAVGHGGLVAAAAVLPWALRTLLAPAAQPAKTFLACVAMAFTGIGGATLTVVPLLVGLCAERRHRNLGRAVLAAAVAQLPWLLPAFFVGAKGVHYLDSRSFATDAKGPLGVLGLVAGHGFWRAPSQVGGGGGVGVALLAAGLLLLGILGTSRLRRVAQRRAAAAAAAGFVVSLASAVPGVRSLYHLFTQTPLGLLMREGQRVLPVFLVWLAPAAAFGAARLAEDSERSREFVRALPLVGALVLAAPGLWGLGGVIRPVQLPAEWGRARATIKQQPGTVLALPFHEYLALAVARGRVVLNPLPAFFGGDVLSSSDPELGAPHREAVDSREAPMLSVLASARAGGSTAGALAALGVRWVVVLHDSDWRHYASLRTDPGLEWTNRGSQVDLFRVVAWRGPIRTDDGRQLTRRALAAPLGTVAASGPATWDHTASWGWLRGLSAAGETPQGLLRLPSGRGPVWFWPSLLLIAIYLVIGICVVGCLMVVLRHASPTLTGSVSTD